jgi:hypothetical protein
MNGINLNENLSSFIGNLTGSSLSFIGSFIVLYITIKSSNEQQLKSIKEQSAIQVENNLREKFNNEKENFKEAYNALEQFIFTSKTFSVDNGNFSIVLDKLNSSYAEYRKCINTVLISTDVYTLKDCCVGCNLCDIKLYGELARVLKDIQNLIRVIEEDSAFINLKHNNMFQLAISNQQNIQNKDLITSLINNLFTQFNSVKKTNTEKASKIEQEIAITKEKIENLNKAIQEINIKIQDENKYIIEKLTKLEQIKLEFYNKIKEYFLISNEYKKEYITFVEKNGRLFNNKCKKYNLDSNEHDAKK